MATHATRRQFFEKSGKAGLALIVGFYAPTRASGQQATGHPGPWLNAWLRITPDNQITVLVEIPEIGQGSRTVDTMILAEELEADWRTIKVEQAPVIPDVYKNLSTGGSGGTSEAWGYLRQAGAQARELLITAAAQVWGTDRKDCRAERGTVVHTPSERRLSYGELVVSAAKLPPIPADKVLLKRPSEYRLVGKPVARVDIPSKVDGSGVFGIDIRVPGMLFAVMARCPHFGGKLESFDATTAKAVPGVRAVFAVPPIAFIPQVERNINSAGGVAVVADSTWAAMQGRKALKISWNKGTDATEDTDQLSQALREAARGPASFVAVNQGDALATLANATRRIEASYELPFQAHATMEPMNTTVHVRDDGIEVWTPTQNGKLVQEEIAVLSGSPADKVRVHMLLCGGSFGRRYHWDYIAQAWQVAKEINQPVQLLWTRDDDMQHDFYRQYSYHRLSGAVSDEGNVTAWSHRVASTSIRAIFDPPALLKAPKQVARQELGGADVIPYAIPNFRVDYAPVHSAVPRAWWRSVANSFNAFAVECFVDELAHLAGLDPYQFRMDLMREDRKLPGVMWTDGNPLETRRLRSVLQLAAEKAAWGRPLPAGSGCGIACHFSFESYVAYVAQVSVERGAVRVRRVTAAVDCGTAVNPDGVRAMIEGAVNFALTPVLTGEITTREASVRQSNFHDYKVLRIAEAPEVDVHIVPGGGEPGGMGETGVPALAPAIANAVFAATGKRVRRLPIDPKTLA